MHFTIKVADRIIAIDSRYDYIKEYCKDYCVSDTEADMYISVTEQEIEAERVMDEGYTFSSGYLETLAVLRKIGELLANDNRFLFHGVVIAYDRDDGYMFTAVSGTGKSTHARLWKKYLKDAVEVVNGDKPIIAVENKEAIAYGTPWAGKEGWQKNRGVRLKGICIIKPRSFFSILPLKKYLIQIPPKPFFYLYTSLAHFVYKENLFCPILSKVLKKIHSCTITPKFL
jgi:hypothetical protein